MFIKSELLVGYLLFLLYTVFKSIKLPIFFETLFFMCQVPEQSLFFPLEQKDRAAHSRATTTGGGAWSSARGDREASGTGCKLRSSSNSLLKRADKKGNKNM